MIAWTSPGWHGRMAVTAVVLVAVALAAPVAAEARSNSLFGDYVKAARMIRDWRYDEARVLIADLERRAPQALETRYLAAELAFVDGAYERVGSLLDGIDDSVAGGNVGQLRQLAASTRAVTQNFVVKPSAQGHFAIAYDPDKDSVIADLAGATLDAAYQVLGADFGYFPPETIRVEILSRPADLASMSPLTKAEIETTGTIALCKYGKLMVVSPRATVFGYPWMDTLVHEYVHYVVSRLSHDTVPVWLHEGLARFQQTRWRKPPDGTLSATDAHLIATALRQGKLISFDDMHPSMAKLPSQHAAALAFAEVYTMVTYIHEKVGYPGIRQIIALQRDGKSARRAVAETLKKPWRRVERNWKSYLRKRDFRASKALASRAQGRRIRFDKGGEHDENVGVDEVASGKAQKYARLGGMLRARGMSEAAAKEYEKALQITGSTDPFVAAKLSRTYLELGEHAKAIALARPLFQADEYDAAPAVTLGLAFLATNELEQARDAFEAGLRVNPFDPTVRCGLSEVYEQQAEAALAQRERDACARLRQ